MNTPDISKSARDLPEAPIPVVWQRIVVLQVEERPGKENPFPKNVSGQTTGPLATSEREFNVVLVSIEKSHLAFEENLEWPTSSGLLPCGSRFLESSSGDEVGTPNSVPPIASLMHVEGI
jgi:hypothetical protein